MMKKTKYILVTGGAGYIGSHTSVELLNAGHNIVILDNLSNSHKEVIDNIRKITKASPEQMIFIKGDLKDTATIEKVFQDYSIHSVIHFAGYKSVGESVSSPLSYYDNNVVCMISLLKACQQYKCYNIVFSSSATIYGLPEELPIYEDHTLQAINPYGSTKLIGEMMLKDLSMSDENWRICALRYFNPIGAHKSHTIGENPKDIPNNLMPIIVETAQRKREHVKVFGNDWPTSDGTGVRDYIHVVDLAHAHVKSLTFLEKNKGFHPFNLSKNQGTSVLELINSFENVNEVEIPYIFTDRRPGDAGEVFANSDKAQKTLKWKPENDIDEMCRSSWQWAKNNMIEKL